jgi:hypothetical protein
VSAAAVGKGKPVGYNGLIMRFSSAKCPLGPRFTSCAGRQKPFITHYSHVLTKNTLFFKNWPQILQVSPISDRLFFKMVTKS